MNKKFGILGKMGILGKLWNIGRNLEYCCKSTIFQTKPQYSKKSLNIPQYSNYSELGSLTGILGLAVVGELFPTFQRQPATPGQVPGASREAPDHWTGCPMLPLPKCFYFQANTQRAGLAMTGKMTSSGLALALAKTGIFRHFLSMPMIFVIRGCHEQ